MRTKIHTMSRGTLCFWANDNPNGAYVYLEDKGPGTTGSQICEGGGFRGNTVRCNGTPEGLARAARRWWRQARTQNF